MMDGETAVRIRKLDEVGRCRIAGDQAVAVVGSEDAADGVAWADDIGSGRAGGEAPEKRRGLAGEGERAVRISGDPEHGALGGAGGDVDEMAGPCAGRPVGRGVGENSGRERVVPAENRLPREGRCDEVLAEVDLAVQPSEGRGAHGAAGQIDGKAHEEPRDELEARTDFLGAIAEVGDDDVEDVRNPAGTGSVEVRGDRPVFHIFGILEPISISDVRQRHGRAGEDQVETPCPADCDAAFHAHGTVHRGIRTRERRAGHGTARGIQPERVFQAFRIRIAVGIGTDRPGGPEDSGPLGITEAALGGCHGDGERLARRACRGACRQGEHGGFRGRNDEFAGSQDIRSVERERTQRRTARGDRPAQRGGAAGDDLAGRCGERNDGRRHRGGVEGDVVEPCGARRIFPAEGAAAEFDAHGAEIECPRHAAHGRPRGAVPAELIENFVGGLVMADPPDQVGGGVEGMEDHIAPAGGHLFDPEDVPFPADGQEVAIAPAEGEPGIGSATGGIHPRLDG